jgi:sulfotransferase
MKQIVFLSGLPRTGSTLLSAILSQNPKIHAEGNSAVCQLMWDVKKACLTTSSEQLKANNKLDTVMNDFVSQVPNIYYKNVSENIIIDKCRSWSIPSNIELIKEYICKDYKIIILERPVNEILKSFAKLYKANNRMNDWNNLVGNKMLEAGTEPIMRSITGVKYAKDLNDPEHFLFISYNDLINDKENTIKKIYDFCGWEYFKHDFNNVVVKHPENDAVYNLQGQHVIRPVVEKIKNDTTISKNLEDQCLIIDKLMGYV